MTQDREAQASLLNYMKKILGINVSMIAAVSRNNVIGLDGELPWDIPEDLQFFKNITMGKSIIMGRTTYASIGRLLPGRKNVVLTHDVTLLKKGSTFQNTIQGAVSEALRFSDDIMIIGGESIYTLFLPYANTIYLTEIDTIIDGDTKFPSLNDDWANTVGNTLKSNGLRYRHCTYTRENE